VLRAGGALLRRVRGPPSEWLSGGFGFCRKLFAHHRGDCENAFDELKNQWGWGGFTTYELKCCRLLAGGVALIYNWWRLFVRLADPNHRPEAVTPSLADAGGRSTNLACLASDADHHAWRTTQSAAYQQIAGFLAKLRQTAEQLNPVQRCYRILTEALKRQLKGRQLNPPPHLATA
jgi:hypothetical protein